MKVQIKNLGDLRDFLNNLTPEQLAQPGKVIANTDINLTIQECEITEEPFLEHKVIEDEVGYPSDLKKHRGEDFKEEDYNVFEPIGTVLIFL